MAAEASEIWLATAAVTRPTLPSIVWSATELADPQAGNLVVYIRPNSREVATLDTPAVVQQITSALQQDAETQVQAKISDALSELLLEADVTIDPRYGRWDPTDPMLVLAPPVPAQPGPPSTTTPPLNLG